MITYDGSTVLMMAEVDLRRFSYIATRKHENKINWFFWRRFYYYYFFIFLKSILSFGRSFQQFSGILMKTFQISSGSMPRCIFYSPRPPEQPQNRSKTWFVFWFFIHCVCLCVKWMYIEMALGSQTLCF